MKCHDCRNDAVEGKARCEGCLAKKRQYNQTHKGQHTEWLRMNWWVHMVSCSKRKDIKKGLFDPDDHIDKELLQYRFDEQKGKCFYCNVAMITHSLGLGQGNITPDRLTVERMDNRTGHTKENCILACFRCNSQRSDRYGCNEFYEMKEAERVLNSGP